MLLATALAGALAFGASAQSDNRDAKEKELETARAELERAARRVAALSRELGTGEDGVFVLQQRMLRKPVLGVLLEEDDGRGVRVSGVTPASGAARAGLRTGDRILSIDGRALTGADGAARLDSLRERLADLQAGKPVRVGYERDGRRAEVSITPEAASPVAFFGGDGSELRPRGDVRLVRGEDGAVEIEAEAVDIRTAPDAPTVIERSEDDGRGGRRVIRRVIAPVAAGPGVAPEVHREVMRLARDGACGDGQDCRSFALAEAFRWNGLNLASLDAQLGRYFGTSEGVLVVSAGAELAGLQSGDVIRRVDGKAVASPREVMDQLRGKPEGASVAIEVLRERRPLTVQVRAPKAMRIPLPPPAPAAAREHRRAAAQDPGAARRGYPHR
ncbi:PDZ domain-containing protein, partial [Lysobacter sp. N42]|uniref:PDZ domain-containing protein n=1 Tax=Lysobacter sp. N42 TaxID=2545719 RepID=UPI001A9F3B1F